MCSNKCRCLSQYDVTHYTEIRRDSKLSDGSIVWTETHPNWTLAKKINKTNVIASSTNTAFGTLWHRVPWGCRGKFTVTSWATMWWSSSFIWISLSCLCKNLRGTNVHAACVTRAKDSNVMGVPVPQHYIYNFTGRKQITTLWWGDLNTQSHIRFWTGWIALQWRTHTNRLWRSEALSASSTAFILCGVDSIQVLETFLNDFGS